MNTNNVIVNETHMCVLRRVENEDRVKVDYVELVSPYLEQLDELRRMSENDNRTILDLQDYVKGSSLRRFMSDFDFCSCLSGAYQWVNCLSVVTFDAYQKRMEQFDKDKDEPGKEQYAREQRKLFYNRIKARDLPATIEAMYYTLEHEPSVLAYSHRRVGWAWPAFNLNDDIRVVFNTNFGYGCSSYFFLQIYYKSIGILPYSEWVHYRFASTADIIRYTRRYHLENNEWMKAMTFTADTYNAAIANPTTFVQKNIMNEVQEMVDGLESIHKARHYKVLENYFHPGCGVYITGEELTLFKGEKISGALDFLEQLQTLRSISDDVETFIQRIIDCNLSVVAELQKAVDSKKLLLKSTLERIEKEQPKWDELSSKNDEYEKMRKELYDSIIKEDEFYGKALNTIRDERDRRFAEEHPDYAMFKKEYDVVNTLYNDLCTKRDVAQSYITTLQSYIDKIKKHKNHMSEHIAA